MTVPKAGVYGFNWFNVCYTPGVSKVSTTIRENNETAYDLSNKGNFIGVVSDSTRVLGDGDCTPAGGLGIMEGKAFLMKYLGGVDAVALCIDNRDKDGKLDTDKIIDLVKMVQPSFGGINLEDISLRGQGGGGCGSCYRTGRFSQPGEQFTWFPRDSEGVPAGKGEKDHG